MFFFLLPFLCIIFLVHSRYRAEFPSFSRISFGRLYFPILLHWYFHLRAYRKPVLNTFMHLSHSLTYSHIHIQAQTQAGWLTGRQAGWARDRIVHFSKHFYSKWFVVFMCIFTHDIPEYYMLWATGICAFVCSSDR